MRQSTSITAVKGRNPAWILILMLAACQPKPPESRPEGALQNATAGGLEGSVRLAGDAVPVPDFVQNTTDPAICGRTHSRENLLVSGRDRGISGAIVAFLGVPAEKIPAPAFARLVLDNIGCRFVPHVSVLTVGSEIEAVNSDPVLHTVHLYGAVETNIGLPFKGTRVAKTVNTPGMIVVKCDVHGWMQAFIRVDEHPFHAVTDASGVFRIPEVPPGDYVIESWHETLGQQQRTVHIREGVTERIDIQYSLESK